MDDIILNVNISKYNSKCTRFTQCTPVLLYILYTIILYCIIIYLTSVSNKKNIVTTVINLDNSIIITIILNIIITSCVLYIICCYFNEKIAWLIVTMLIIIGLLQLFYLF